MPLLGSAALDHVEIFVTTYDEAPVAEYLARRAPPTTGGM